MNWKNRIMKNNFSAWKQYFSHFGFKYFFQTVECVNASLTSIPGAIDHDTQVLDLAHNYLPLIATDLFKKLRLPHLQKIYLSHCSIHTVEEHSFR